MWGPHLFLWFFFWGGTPFGIRLLQFLRAYNCKSISVYIFFTFKKYIYSFSFVLVIYVTYKYSHKIDDRYIDSHFLPQKYIIFPYIF